MTSRALPIAILVVLSTSCVFADEPPAESGQAMLRDYFRRETKKIADACLADIKTLDDWTSRRDEYRRQLLEMLGLDPLPEKTARSIMTSSPSKSCTSNRGRGCM